MRKPSLINGRTITGSLVIGILLSLCLVGWLWLYRPLPSAPAPAVITLLPGPTSTVQATLTPTVDIYIPTATPRPGDIAVGQYVQIKGTEGQGLRIRSAPGLNGEMVFLGYDAEVFLIKDGPVQKDEYTWWYLVAPYDDARAGWAAADFLSYISSP
jgi:hypothetical protein